MMQSNAAVVQIDINDCMDKDQTASGVDNSSFQVGDRSQKSLQVDGSTPQMGESEYLRRQGNMTEARTSQQRDANDEGVNQATNQATVDESFGKPDSRLNRSQRPHYEDNTTPIQESRSETEVSQIDGPLYVKDNYGNIMNAKLLSSSNNLSGLLKSANMTTNVFNMQANIGGKPTVGGTVEPRQHDASATPAGDGNNSVMNIQANTHRGAQQAK